MFDRGGSALRGFPAVPTDHEKNDADHNQRGPEGRQGHPQTDVCRNVEQRWLRQDVHPSPLIRRRFASTLVSDHMLVDGSLSYAVSPYVGEQTYLIEGRSMARTSPMPSPESLAIVVSVSPLFCNSLFRIRRFPNRDQGGPWRSPEAFSERAPTNTGDLAALPVNRARPRSWMDWSAVSGGAGLIELNEPARQFG